MIPRDHLKDLEQQHSLIRDRIRAVVHGNATGMYLHGRPGTSKTFLVETTLKGLAVGYVPHRGVITANGFLELIKASGARLWACRLSADMNHLTEEDLWEGVDGILNASDFIEMTDGAQLLFI